MKITDTGIALMVLRDEIRSSIQEKVDAVLFLIDNGSFYRLPGDLQAKAQTILDQYHNHEGN